MSDERTDPPRQRFAPTLSQRAREVAGLGLPIPQLRPDPGPRPIVRQHVEFIVAVRVDGPIDPDDEQGTYDQANAMIERLVRQVGDMGVEIEVLSIHPCERSS